MAAPTIIHFLRHGLVHNPDQILYARLPRFRLSTEGQRQAAAAGEYLKDRPLTAIWSSPMLRARQTARAIEQHHALPVRISHLITETHTPHEGKPLAELAATNWDLFSDLPPGYETTPDIFDRAQRFIRRLRREYAGGEVAAVSHGHVLLWMHLWVRGLPFTLETQFDIDPFPETASITTLTFDDGADLPTLTYHRPY
jgi:broad specificity phosphatase PhoE